eukprot:49501_1
MASSLSELGYVSMVVTLINMLTQLFIIIHLIRNTKKKLPNKSIMIAYISCIFYCLYSFNTFIQSIYSVSASHFNAAVICTYRYMTPSCFLIAKILMLIFYLSRLYKLFRGTSYEYNVHTLQIFAAFIIIGFSISGVCFSIVAISGLSIVGDELSTYTSFGDCLNAINQAPNRMILTSTAIGCNLLVDLVSSIIILRLYLRKLILLSLAYDHWQFKSKMQKQKNEKFMKLMLKTTNLVIVSVATEYSLIFVNGARIGEYWLAFNHTINVLCIYLSFGGFNDKLYDKLCCCIDKCCSKCCGRLCFCCCMPSNVDSTIMVTIQENSTVNSLEKSKDSKLQVNSIESSPVGTPTPNIPTTPTITVTNGSNMNKNIEISTRFNKAIIDPVHDDGNADFNV